jgi:hypothetical protein
MSYQDQLKKIVPIAEDLLETVSKLFTKAAEEVNSPEYDLAGKMEKAKAAVLAASMEDAINTYTKTDKPLQNEFQLFRHVRDGKVDEAGNRQIASGGGLTFFIDVKHLPEPEIMFGLSVQEPGKNFRRRLGCNESKGRFDAGQHITVPYDTSESLLQNIQKGMETIVLLSSVDQDIKPQLDEAKIGYTTFVKATNMLREYTESLPRQSPGDPLPK